MNDGKQAALSAIQKINAVEGFDPTPLAVEYVDLNTQEKRSRLPVMAQLAWFRLKYPEGRVSVAVTAAKDCFVATARVYPSYIPATQTRPNSICRRRPHPADTKPTNRRYLRVNGRRPPPLGSLFAMPALDFSSARPVIPSTLRLWMSWAASSGVGRTNPRLRCRRTCRRRLHRWRRSPPQSRRIRWKKP